MPSAGKYQRKAEFFAGAAGIRFVRYRYRPRKARGVVVKT
jgi:hypothetical protein